MRSALRVAAPVAAVLLAFAGPPALASAGTISASPTSGLIDGQQITVRGSGFAAGDEVWISQCGTIGGLLRCSGAEGQVVSAVADASGSVSAQLLVRTTFTGYDENGQPAGQIDCAQASGCFVSASVGTGPELNRVAISFR
ncbi:hypothetical protein BBK82_30925 [Lentzea guizhouensis]|uniref:Neocarzinostatin n=1 Tax=Lentzea guizhouensis TaxID=1586287 RepID=A0A1B2HQ03_9PSEU|nr:enediyne antibiotic chromoprotein [Lentzea guizhouensis]ANZ39800.1 hypothetical protein BBK82_30925 [Lentzea guizhouensis]